MSTKGNDGTIAKDYCLLKKFDAILMYSKQEYCVTQQFYVMQEHCMCHCQISWSLRKVVVVDRLLEINTGVLDYLKRKLVSLIIFTLQKDIMMDKLVLLFPQRKMMC